jgi:hypothetical protein
MNQQQEKEIYVKPENRMSEEEMSSSGLGDPRNKMHPVIEIIEDQTMPLYIFGKPLVFKSTFGNANLDIMLTILHHIKDNKLELRGRIRYESTGRKTIFSNPKMFEIYEYENAKKELENMYLELIENSPFKPAGPAWALEIPIKATANDVIELLEESNHFNIGISSKE